MFRRCSTLVMCALMVLAGVSSAGAQQFTGGVRGLVRDANGEAVPSASVQLQTIEFPPIDPPLHATTGPAGGPT